MSTDALPRDEVDTHVAALAGYGLPGSLTSLPASALPRGEWRTLVSLVRQHRLTGLLSAAVQQGAMPVTSEQAEEAGALGEAATARSIRVDHALAATVDLLAGAGVDVHVLGDTALARLDYSSPVRGTDSLELLARWAQRGPAEMALTEAGWCPDATGWVRAYDRIHLRLHWSPAGAVGDRGGALEVAGRSMRAVDRENRLLHLVSLRGPGEATGDLRHLRDVAEMTLHRDLDPHRALALARERRVEPILADAVRATWGELRLADAVVLSAWARSAVDDHRRPNPTAAEPQGRHHGAGLAVEGGARPQPRFGRVHRGQPQEG